MKFKVRTKLKVLSHIDERGLMNGFEVLFDDSRIKKLITQDEDTVHEMNHHLNEEWKEGFFLRMNGMSRDQLSHIQVRVNRGPVNGGP